MKRKLVKQGASTLMLSIPTKWAKQYKLEKGDELDVIEQGSRLVVATDKLQGLSKGELDIDNLRPMILRGIEGFYKAGCDELKVTFTDSSNMIHVHEALQNDMASYEVIEQGKNYAILRDIEGSLKEGFDPILRRTFMLLLTMADDSYEAIKNGNFEELKQLRLLEKSNNKFTTYLHRHMSKHGYRHNKIQFMYHIVEILEHIADQYKFLFDYLVEHRKKPLLQSTLDYYKRIAEFLREYYGLFYKYEAHKVSELGKFRKKLVKDILEDFYDEKNSDTVVLHYLLIQIQNSFDLISPLLSLLHE